MKNVNKGFGMACGCFLFLLVLAALMLILPGTCVALLSPAISETESADEAPIEFSPELHIELSAPSESEPPAKGTPPTVSAAPPPPREFPNLQPGDSLSRVQRLLADEGKKTGTAGTLEIWTFHWAGKDVQVTFKGGELEKVKR